MPESRHRQTSSKSDRQRAAIHRRLELQRAHEAAERRAIRRRRRLRALAVAGCVLVVAGPVAIVVWVRTHQPPPPPELRAAKVAGAKGQLGMAATPAGYRVRYRIETLPGGAAKNAKPAVTTEDVTVRRPFEGRIVERAGSPPGDALQLDLRTRLGLRGDYSKADAPQVTQQEPSLAIGDVRLDQSLGDLVSGGFFKMRERRRLLGRECQVYRTGSPVESLSVTAPNAENYADACIDAAGLLLEELSVSGRQLTTRVTAVEVDDQPVIGADAFAVQGQPSADASGLSLQTVDPATPPPAGSYRFTAPPAGFASVARLVLTVGDANGTPQHRLVDVFSRGADALIVEQGPKAAEPEPGILPPTAVDGGALGPAQFVPGLAGNTLTAHPLDDWFVRVTATLSRDDLRAAVASMRPA